MQGARTPLYCATSPEVATDSGDYYEVAHRKQPGAAATPELGAELWDRTSEWIDRHS